MLAMFKTGYVSAIFFFAAGMTAGVIGGPRAGGQRPAYPIVREIQVDSNCRVQPDPARPVAVENQQHPDQRFRKDPLVCGIDTVNSSEHVEETIVGNERRRNRVAVDEKEFVLQNTTQDRVAFVVEQPVSKGWIVDSDPKPTQLRTVNSVSVAIFRVYAEPGQIVHLHVGERHTTPMKTKIIRTSGN
jgi:hypothetical protein